MGNQQILLFVIVTVIVCLATLIAVNVFADNSIIANRTAVRQDLTSGANIAQSLHMKPHLLGGAGGNFTRVEESILVSLMIPGSMNGSEQWENENGVYSVEDVSRQSLVIRGNPSTGEPDVIALLQYDTENNAWIVHITDDE